MIKRDIKKYWKDRLIRQISFHDECRKKHREKLPQKITRRIKRDCFQPTKKGKNLELFLPAADNVAKRVINSQKDTEKYFEKLQEFERKSVDKLLSLLNDDDDYDFEIQIRNCLNLGSWLERAKKLTGDGSGYENDIADLNIRLINALDAKKRGKYMPDKFIEHLQKQIKQMEKALLCQKKKRG